MKRLFLIVSSISILIIALSIGYYFLVFLPQKEQSKIEKEKAVEQNFIEKSSINIKLSQEKPQLIETSEEEAVEIEKVIVIFEEFKYKKDFVSAIKMITPPTNQEEKGWLDHLLGNDLAKLNNGKPSPRFFLNVNYHLLVGYEIKKITKKEEVFFVYAKELRVLNMAGEWINPKYEAEMQDITFELLNNGKNYEISRYHHTNYSSIANLKYEGFEAFWPF